MTAAPLPSVTALVAAFDAAVFVDEAVRSALAQDYPPHLLDVVVVDDGSTDATAAVVEALVAQHPTRVRLIRQENRGSVGAVNRAAAAARGDLLAILDADDAWPPEKIARQVALLQARPEVGLVYTDMEVIDADGATLQASWLEGQVPPEGRPLGRLLEENLVTGSSIVVRASLREQLFPLPETLAWADWPLALRTAQVSDLAFLPGVRTRYRFHGANMSLGVHGAARLRELRRALALQRHFLRTLTAPATAPADLEQAWDAFSRAAGEALAVAGSPFARLVVVDDEDRAAALALSAEARVLLAGGDQHAALAAAVRGAAADPASDAARAALLAVRAALPAGRGAQPLRGARPFVVRLQADEVARDAEVLTACVEEVGDLPDVTLAIDASAVDAVVAAQQIDALANVHGLLDHPTVDLLLVTGPLDELGRARLQAGTSARVGPRRGDDATPCFTLDRLAALRALALARRAA